MKKLLTVAAVLLVLQAQAQHKTNYYPNRDRQLTTQEATQLNSSLKGVRNTFDFSGKTIAFANGSKLTTKTAGLKALDNHQSSPEHVSLVLLSNEEKAITGGYDAVIVYGDPASVNDKMKEKLVKALKTSGQ